MRRAVQCTVRYETLQVEYNHVLQTAVKRRTSVSLPHSPGMGVHIEQVAIIRWHAACMLRA